MGKKQVPKGWEWCSEQSARLECARQKAVFQPHHASPRWVRGSFKKQLDTVVSGALPRYTTLRNSHHPTSNEYSYMQINAQHPTIFSFAPRTLNGAGPGTQSELRDRKDVPRPFTKVPTAVGPCLGLKDNNSTSPEVSGSQTYQVWVSCCRIRFLCRGSSSLPLPPFPKSPVFLHQVLPGQEGVVRSAL